MDMAHLSRTPEINIFGTPALLGQFFLIGVRRSPYGEDDDQEHEHNSVLAHAAEKKLKAS